MGPASQADAISRNDYAYRRYRETLAERAGQGEGATATTLLQLAGRGETALRLSLRWRSTGPLGAADWADAPAQAVLPCDDRATAGPRADR